MVSGSTCRQKFLVIMSVLLSLHFSIDLKVLLGKVIVDEKGIKDLWKEYMETLMNEEMNGIIGYRLELKRDQ